MGLGLTVLSLRFSIDHNSEVDHSTREDECPLCVLPQVHPCLNRAPARRVFFLLRVGPPRPWKKAGRVKYTRHLPSHTNHEETSQPATTALQSMGVVLSETRPAPGCQGLS